MSTLIKVPDNYDVLDPEQTLVGEGEHTCVVKNVTQDAATQVRIQYQVLEGSDKGLVIEQTYWTEHRHGLRLFKQLMEAIGVHPKDGSIDLDEGVGKKLVVTVAHRVHNGKTFANAVAHRKFQ